jgi:hypothetical protein
MFCLKKNMQQQRRQAHLQCCGWRIFVVPERLPQQQHGRDDAALATLAALAAGTAATGADATAAAAGAASLTNGGDRMHWQPHFSAALAARD